MEAVLDVAAGTGVILFVLATAFIERPWGRLLTVAAAAAVAWAVHPIAVRQSLTAFVGGLDAADVRTLAAVLALDGVLGSAGAVVLLRAPYRPPLRRWRRLAAHHVGVIPLLALFYLETKAFGASAWPFSVTALGLCLAVAAVGLAGSAAVRRLLPQREPRVELRLLVHVGQVALAAGLTAFAWRGGAESTAPPLEAGPHAVVAGASALGVLAGYWSHRRRLRRGAG